VGVERILLDPRRRGLAMAVKSLVVEKLGSRDLYIAIWEYMSRGCFGPSEAFCCYAPTKIQVSLKGCSPEGARSKTDSSNAFTACARIHDLDCSHFGDSEKRWKGLRPIFFGPCTLRRTWGTRPEPKTVSRAGQLVTWRCKVDSELTYYEHKKREGDFSCETSPSLFRFSEIRFGFRITTLALPESLVTHELTLARSLLFSDHCRRKNFLAATRFQFPGRVSLPILEDDCLSALSSGRSLFR
jgi:hypothetical protein